MKDNVRKKYMPFHVKLTTFITAFFLIMIAAILWMFYHTNVEMKEMVVSKLQYGTKDVSTSLDEIVLNVYSVSEAFAVDDRLTEYTSGDYTDNPIKKRMYTVKIINNLFESYDFLRKNQRMAAFYTRKGELFNFIDPNADDELCKEKLSELDINSREKLAKFYWYGVRDNFFKSDKSGNIRKDMAIIGSRRVFSRMYDGYDGVHLFAVSEETLYNCYKEILNQYGSMVYITDENGNLLSSSDENILRNGKVDDELADWVHGENLNSRFINKGKDLVTAEKSELNGWITVIVTPMSAITKEVDKLQKNLLWVIVFCGALAMVAVRFLYGRFIAPVSLLNNSMQRVYNGDFTAYVQTDKRNSELEEMINYYNSMLESINRNVEQRIRTEQHKKELEMEVLMNQINPHFLYNTLETIIWQAAEAGRGDISRLAAALGRMYRLSVSGGDVMVTLKNELEHVMTYIKIQESRYEGKFEFDAAMADRDMASEYYTLKIILQPIVENAINHGMDGIDRILKIRIRIDIKDDRIKIRVIDNGIGMTRDKLKKVRDRISGKEPGEIAKGKSSNLGMRNINDRLKIYFGTENALKIHSKYNVGTIVEINIPKITKDEADKRNKNKYL